MVTIIADNKHFQRKNISFSDFLEITITALKQETAPFASIVLLGDEGESITIVKTPEGIIQFENKEGKEL